MTIAVPMFRDQRMMLKTVKISPKWLCPWEVTPENTENLADTRDWRLTESPIVPGDAMAHT